MPIFTEAALSSTPSKPEEKIMEVFLTSPNRHAQWSGWSGTKGSYSLRSQLKTHCPKHLYTQTFRSSVNVSHIYGFQLI